VVTAGARMYFLQQLAALILEDALHEFASFPMLLDLAVDENKRFSRQAMRRASVGSEGSFPSTNRSRIGKHSQDL
jgi:hypothetical protein